MTTEILGFIIILGAVIVLLARQHLNKSEDDPEVLEAATGRLRYELEQSADEIINRMTEHVDRLERMLREADYKAELLQQKLTCCSLWATWMLKCQPQTLIWRKRLQLLYILAGKQRPLIILRRAMT